MTSIRGNSSFYTLATVQRLLGHCSTCSDMSGKRVKTEVIKTPVFPGGGGGGRSFCLHLQSHRKDRIFRSHVTFDLVLAGAIKYTRCLRDVHVEVESHGQSKYMTSFPVKCKHITLSFPYKVKVKGGICRRTPTRPQTGVRVGAGPLSICRNRLEHGGEVVLSEMAPHVPAFIAC